MIAKEGPKDVGGAPVVHEPRCFWRSQTLCVFLSKHHRFDPLLLPCLGGKAQSMDNPEWESPRDAEVESLFVLPAFGLEVGERSVSQLEVHRG